jgi:hypothetical protein
MSEPDPGESRKPLLPGQGEIIQMKFFLSVCLKLAARG